MTLSSVEVFYDAIQPTVLPRPRMYGLPKMRKEGTPLCPVLSMTEWSHHERRKWLASCVGAVLITLHV